MRYSRNLAILFAIALLPVLPYALLGYAGQDLPFHVSSWLDLRDAWLTGRLTPGWSASANLGLGDPHLTLYPPVSLYLGGLLTLILPLRFVPAAFVSLCALLGGVTMHSVGRHFLRAKDRLPAAVLYMLSPYLILSAFVRFAAAELLVIASLPLILLAFHQTLWPTATEGPAPQAVRPVLRLALPLALTWLTDIPAAIVLLYGLFASALVCAWLQRSAKPLVRLGLSNALAAMLAAFYLAPAFVEQHWVSASALVAANPGMLLLFMPQSGLTSIVRGSPLVFACWLFLCVESVLLIRFFRPLRVAARTLVPHVSPLRRRPSTTALTPAASRMATLATLALFAILFQLSIAYPFWRYLPELRFVQFPFRFLALLGAVLPLLLFAPQWDEGRLTSPPRTRPACIAVGALSLIALLGYASMTGLSHRRNPPLATFAARSTSVPEYLPAGASLPSNTLHLEAVRHLTPETVTRCSADPAQMSPNLRAFHTRTVAPCQLRVALFFYPFWCAFDESLHPLPATRSPDGLLLVNVPAGDHLITLAFHPASRIRTASALLSTLALTLTAVLLLARPRRVTA